MQSCPPTRPAPCRLLRPPGLPPRLQRQPRHLSPPSRLPQTQPEMLCKDRVQAPWRLSVPVLRAWGEVSQGLAWGVASLL